MVVTESTIFFSKESYNITTSMLVTGHIFLSYELRVVVFIG